MAYKYTVQLNVTITTESEANVLMQKIYDALKNTGTSVLIQQTNCLQWVDQVSSTPQLFNDDGTPQQNATTADTATMTTA